MNFLENSMGRQKLSTRIPKFWILQHFSTQIRLLSLMNECVFSIIAIFAVFFCQNTMMKQWISRLWWSLMIIGCFQSFWAPFAMGGTQIFADFFPVKSHNDETFNVKISRLWRNHWLFSIILGNRIPKFWILELFLTQIRLVFTWICFALVSGAHFGSLFHHLAVKEEEKINENQTTDLFWWISWFWEKFWAQMFWFTPHCLPFKLAWLNSSLGVKNRKTVFVSVKRLDLCSMAHGIQAKWQIQT